MIIILLLIIKCVNCFFGMDSDELFGPASPFNPSKKLKSELSSVKRKLLDERHPFSLQNPVDQLLRAEIDFVDKCSIRIELLFDSIKILISDKEFAGKLEPIIERNYENMLEIVKKALTKLQNDLIALTKEYEQANYELKQREHSTFITYNHIQDIFNIIKDLKTKLEMEINNEIINIIKKKILLTTLSLRIIFLESVYSLGYFKGLNMSFIQPTIYYLLIYEYGISYEIGNKSMEEINTFNNYLNNYIKSWDKLVQFVLFHIKEHELVMDKSETLFHDLQIMYNDFNNLLTNII